MSSFYAKGTKVGCRLGVWDLNAFRVSLAAFQIGEESSFSLGSFEPVCFKGVYLMDPEAPSIFLSVMQPEAKTWKESGGPWAVQICSRNSESWSHLQVFHLLSESAKVLSFSFFILASATDL